MAIQNGTDGLHIGGPSGKLGFHGATPVVKRVGAAGAAVTPGNINGAIAALTSSATTTQGEFNALRDACETLADDVRAAVVLLNEMRATVVALGLHKGAA